VPQTHWARICLVQHASVSLSTSDLRNFKLNWPRSAPLCACGCTSVLLLAGKRRSRKCLKGNPILSHFIYTGRTHIRHYVVLMTLTERGLWENSGFYLVLVRSGCDWLIRTCITGSQIHSCSVKPGISQTVLYIRAHTDSSTNKDNTTRFTFTVDPRHLARARSSP
jgi:hypothetical protein